MWCAFTVEQVDATVARDFLAHLEHVRGNATSTRNLRLTALHSLFRFIARQAPELVEHAATIHAIPPRRTAVPAMRHATAVHLLRTGVDINTIRAWLGHVSP